MANEQLQEEYLVTARKWRPLQFKDIVGQEHITITLKNAIKSGRIHHAYLFSGPRGVGKTTTARIYARAINCLNPKDFEPCNECDSCKAVLEGRSMDVIEIDGASNNSVDDIRKLRENAKYPPISGNYKMYVIDEVHMLSTSAFNALLKTLEEPPKHLLFVFATTEAHKVLPTILSRCQRFDFRRMENDSIIQQIKFIAGKENITIDDESMNAIAQKADGSMRDSQSIFDQVVAFCGNDIKYSELANALHLIDKEFFFRISSSIKEKNLKDLFSLTNDIMTKGYDLQECLSGLLEHFRNILTIKVTGNTNLISDSESLKNKYKIESEKFEKNDILRILNLIANTEQTLRYSPQPKIRFEMALVQLASMDSVVDISQLIHEISDLKKKALTAKSSNVSSIEESDSTSEIAKKIKADLNTEPAKPVSKEADLKVNNGFMNLIDNASPSQEETYSKESPSAQTIENRWNDFKKEYAKGENGLLVLNQKEMITTVFFKGEIVLECNNDFLFQSIKNKQNEIKDYLVRFYKAPVNIKIVAKEQDSGTKKTNETIKSENRITTDNKETKFISSNEEPAEKTPQELSPIEQAIVDMFGAREVKIMSNG
jgi:DNA polymerase-3 subunit gamma/tau